MNYTHSDTCSQLLISILCRYIYEYIGHVHMLRDLEDLYSRKLLIFLTGIGLGFQVAESVGEWMER